MDTIQVITEDLNSLAVEVQMSETAMLDTVMFKFQSDERTFELPIMKAIKLVTALERIFETTDQSNVDISQFT